MILKQFFELAFASAESLNQSYVGTEHLLIAIIKYNSPKTQDFSLLLESISNLYQLHKDLSHRVFADLSSEAKSQNKETKELPAPAQTSTKQKPTVLESYGVINYNELASQGKFSKVI